MMKDRKDNLLRFLKHAGVLVLNAVEQITCMCLSYQDVKEKTSWQSAGLALHAQSPSSTSSTIYN